MLDSEIQTPGAFARARMASQNPLLSPAAGRLRQVLGVDGARQLARMHQTVWLFSDATDVRADVAVNLMNLDGCAHGRADTPKSNHDFDSLTTRLQIDMLLDIITRDLELLPPPEVRSGVLARARFGLGRWLVG